MAHNIKTYAKRLELLLKAKKEAKKLRETFIKLYPYAPKEDIKVFSLIVEIIIEIERDEFFNIETIKSILED